MELLFLNTIFLPQGIFHLCFFLLLTQELLRNDAPVATLPGSLTDHRRHRAGPALCAGEHPLRVLPNQTDGAPRPC